VRVTHEEFERITIRIYLEISRAIPARMHLTLLARIVIGERDIKLFSIENILWTARVCEVGGMSGAMRLIICLCGVD